MGIIKLAIGSIFGFTEQPGQIGTTKRNGDSVPLALDVGAIVSFGIAVGTLIYIYFSL